MNNELSKQNLENISGSISCIPITSKSVDSDLDNFYLGATILIRNA